MDALALRKKDANRLWMPVILGLLLLPVITYVLYASRSTITQPDRASHPPPAAGDLITTQTAADGAYRFDGVGQAAHQVWLDVESLPPALRPADAGEPVVLTINPGQRLTSPPVGRGVRFTAWYDEAGAQLSGIVFHDANGDGRHQPDERRLPGVTVIDPRIFIYFVPGPHNDLFTIYDAINTCSNVAPLTDVGIDYVISVTASANGTRVNYDHWEDGYDLNPLVAGATTLTTTLGAGQSQVYTTKAAGTTAPNNDPASIYPFDGRDRITIVGEQVNVVVNNWPSALGTVLAGSWSIRDTARWGRSFIIPVGEDLPVPPEDFEYTALFMMAQAPNTVVTFDIDGPGPAPAQTITLANPGDSYLIPGDPIGDGDPAGFAGVQSGATVTASAPIQVHLFGGACDGTYAGRGGYWIVPTNRLDHEYFAATPFFPSGGACSPPPPGRESRTDLYIRHPGSTTLTVNWATNSATGSFDVPPDTTYRFTSNDDDSGVHLWTDDPAAVFTVIASVDADSITWDWGYELIQVNQLTSQAVMGWSPGTVDLIDNATGNPPPDGIPDPPTGGGTQNGNLAFVVPITNATIYVDLDNDGAPDDFDNTGDGLVNPGTAAGVALNALDVLRVADPVDFDLNGAIIYSADFAQRFSVVWGEDPCNAGRATPHFDGGFSVPPLPVLTLTKVDQAPPAEVDCSLTFGDLITYTINARNVGRGSMNNLVMTDTFDYTNTHLIVGSLGIAPPAYAPPNAVIDYDDGSGAFIYTPAGPPGAADPNVQAWRIRWPTVAAEDLITVTFRVVLAQSPLPPPARVVNVAFAQADSTLVVASTDLEDPLDPGTDTCLNVVDLTLTKDDGLLEVEPGQIITYTIPYTNAGPTTALNVVLTDTLPVGANYVSNSSSPPLPVTFFNTPPKVQFDVGMLASAQSGWVTLTVEVDPSFDGKLITNTAVITTTSIDTNPDNNLAIDVDEVTGPPTAIELLYFTAEPEGPQAIRLAWATAWEIDNWGFKLYRAAAGDPFPGSTLIATIPGQGSSLETTRYDYLDDGLQQGAYSYWLVDVDSHNGTETRHGPVEAILGSTPADLPERVYLPVVMK